MAGLGGRGLVYAQGTAMSFQGQLSNNGTPATGLYDFRLTIYDSAVNGNVIGGPVTNSATGVTNGLFTVAPDFGQGVFTGGARWLDIGVRSSGGGAFTGLGQRQPVLAAPYSIFAGTASNLVSGAGVKSLNGLKDNVVLAPGANISLVTNGNVLTVVSSGGAGVWSLSGASAYYNGGNVGVGTSTPAALLEVAGFNGNTLLYATAPRPNLIFRDTIAGNARGIIGGWGGGLRFYSESFWNGADSTALMTYDTNGNLVIGSANTPQARVDISAPRNALRMSGSRPNLSFVDTDVGYRSGLEAQGGDITLTTEGYIAGVQPNNFAVLRNNGSFCIGTRVADAGLVVANVSSYNTGLKLSGNAIGGTGLALANTAAGGHQYAMFSAAAGDGVGAGGFGIYDDSAGFYRLAITATGNVGINTYQPQSTLDVASGQDALGLSGYQPFLTLKDSNAGYARSRIQGVGGDLVLETEAYINSANPGAGTMVIKSGSGNVGVGTGNPQARLDVAGNTRTCTLTITAGCDLAEPFPLDAEDIPKGSVVVIDKEHPGKLKLSTLSYDKRVAGIVSGANGINPGISLHQEGALDGGENVALSGRVYVLADATNEPIQPGDLLTTSEVPGHAMKVTDYGRAQGAILGKAMGQLDNGRGMVLVLVTLQ
jgi:hypothetical protein